MTAVGDGPELLLADGRRLRSDRVVLAAGVGLSGIAGLGGTGVPEVRPVKGHILRLRHASPDTPRLLPRTVRGLVRGHSVYLVPRRDGSVVVGATVEERGADVTVQAGAVHQLLCDARAIVPGLDELELDEAAAGLRPATPDNTPYVGPLSIAGVVVATGHFRSGIHLAPLTAARRGRPRRRRTIRPRRPGAHPGVTALALTVNGEPFEVAAGSTIADLVARVTEDVEPKGVAVAVDRCVIPRSEWDRTPARAGSLVEVVSASAGG